MAIDPSAYLGTPEGYATKEQLAAAQMLSQLLMKPQQQTMYKPAQGFANIADALIGGYFGHLADQRRIANANKTGQGPTFGVPSVQGAQTAPSLQGSPSASEVQPVRTASLQGTATDASPAGPPPFSQSIANAVSPGVGVSGVQPTARAADTGTPGMTASVNPSMRATIGALTGESPATPSAPVQTAQASGGATASPGGAMGQYGTFYDPDLLPRRVQISDQDMHRYRMERNLGLRPPEEVANYEKMYFEQRQPMSMDTPYGILSWNQNNPNKQFLQPKIEKDTGKAGGVEGPFWTQQTPQGVVIRPMITHQGPQGGGAVSGGTSGGAAGTSFGGPRFGDFQSMSDWANQQKTKETSATEEAKKEVDRYDKMYDAAIANQKSARDELPQLRLLQRVMNDPSYVSGKGSNTLASLSSAGQTMGIGEGRIATLKDFADKLGKAGALENIEEMSMQGAVRVPTLNLIAKSNYDPNNTPDANRAVVEIRARMAERRDEIGSLATQYVNSIDPSTGRKRGRLDAGFDQVVMDAYRDHPLFKPEEIDDFNRVLDAGKLGNTGKATHSPADIEAEMRKRGFLK